MAKRIKGGIKRRETDPASNQFPKGSPQSRTHKEIQSWVKRRGREEIEATWWRKRRAKGGESNHASDLAPKYKWLLKIWFLKVQKQRLKI